MMGGRKRRREPLLSVFFASLVAFTIFLLAGCASAGSSSDVASEAQSQSPASSSLAKDASSSGASAPRKLSKDELRQNNEWADTAVRGALNKLAADGVIATPKSDAETLVEMFEFVPVGDGYDINYLNERAGKELCASYALPKGKVILCRFERDMSENDHHWVRPEYADGDWVNEEVGSNVPLFYPQSLNGHFDDEGSKTILANVPADTFANSVDECDYLVVYDSGASHIDEGYYTGVDRQSTTTLALVVNMREGKVVHIENIGTDTPGKRVKIGQNRGKMLWDECAKYLNTLLTNRPKG